MVVLRGSRPPCCVPFVLSFWLPLTGLVGLIVAVKKSGVKKSSVKKSVAKKVTEKKTGEKYASRAAMMKHEKSEGPKARMKEYGSKKAEKSHRMPDGSMMAGAKHKGAVKKSAKRGK